MLTACRQPPAVVSVKNPALKEESKAAGLPAAGPKPEFTREQEDQMHVGARVPACVRAWLPGRLALG